MIFTRVVNLNPLDALDTLDSYRQLFMDARFWQPYVRQVCVRHSLSCSSIHAGTPGTCPVFIVEDRWVLKFFGRLFDGARSFAAERAVGHLLALHPVVPCATLVAEGRLLAESSSGWDWPYLVFQFLEGTSFGEAFGGPLKTEKLGEAPVTQGIARQLGTWVRALHNLPLPEAGPFETSWSGFERFLAGQWAGCAARHATWGSLPPHLVAQIDAFLPPLSALLDPSIRPHLIHADLTADHLLGQVVDGRWRSLGLIDFGDARTGNLEYELAALHLDLFHGDRQMLAVFFSSYGFTPPADFPRRALAYCLLHQFDLFAPFAGQIRSTQLADLADELWSIESNGVLESALRTDSNTQPPL